MLANRGRGIDKVDTSGCVLGGHELAQVPGQLRVRADPQAGQQQHAKPQQREGDAQAGAHESVAMRRRANASARRGTRSEEHTSELQSLMRTSYAVFCLKQNKKKTPNKH